MAVTQADVATRAGVSRPLVSLVMRGSPHVSAQKREAVLRAATELGYRRNAHAAQLASHRSMIIGIILTEMQNPIFPQILKIAEERAEDHGYGVLLTSGSIDQELERRAVNRLLGHRVDGVVMVGTRLPAREVHDLASAVPVVLIGRRITGVDAVSVDDRAGARIAVEHLIGLGHRRIGHIDGGSGPGARIRRRSYLETMNAHGLSTDILITSGDNTEPGGVAAAQRVLTAPVPPTAIFAANDLTALGVMAAAKDRGIRIPDDLSLIGFDNNPVSAFGYVGLTTIDQAPDDLAATAVAALIARIRDPQRAARPTLVKPQLILRATTSSIPA